MVWGPIIAIYLFLAGAAGGAYITASFISIKYPSAVTMRKVARYVVPVILGVGLIMLVVDAEAGLRHPLRFIGLINNPRSVMTIGVYIICVFMPIALVVAALEWFGKNVPRALDIVGDIFALCLAGYTGFLLGVSMGIPLWNSPVLPALFVTSALTAGVSLVAIIGLILDKKEFAQMTVFGPVHVILAILEIIFITILLVMAAHNGAAGAESVNMIVKGSLAPLFWLGVVGIGILMPVGIDFALSRNLSVLAGRGHTAELVGQTGAVLGSFCLRMVVVLAGVAMILF